MGAAASCEAGCVTLGGVLFDREGQRIFQKREQGSGANDEDCNTDWETLTHPEMICSKRSFPCCDCADPGAGAFAASGGGVSRGGPPTVPSRESRVC